jgi:putative flippase GtrA
LDLKADLRRLTPLLLRFGSVGVLGFLADTAVVYATRHWLGLYGAGLFSYLVVASFNWMLNRHWTFRDRPRASARRQWALFLAANLIGLAINRGTYITLIATVPLCVQYPVLAVAAGAVAGMGINFMASHRLGFR